MRSEITPIDSTRAAAGTNNPEIQDLVARFKITPEDAKSRLDIIEEQKRMTQAFLTHTNSSKRG